MSSVDSLKLTLCESEKSRNMSITVPYFLELVLQHIWNNSHSILYDIFYYCFPHFVIKCFDVFYYVRFSSYRILLTNIFSFHIHVYVFIECLIGNVWFSQPIIHLINHSLYCCVHRLRSHDSCNCHWYNHHSHIFADSPQDIQQVWQHFDVNHNERVTYHEMNTLSPHNSRTNLDRPCNEA